MITFEQALAIAGLKKASAGLVDEMGNINLAGITPEFLEALALVVRRFGNKSAAQVSKMTIDELFNCLDSVLTEFLINNPRELIDYVNGQMVPAINAFTAKWTTVLTNAMKAASESPDPES